ncbi:MAG: dephospho-CoA kinase [Firmicutes bacterium HGW-Firmicutes-8]|nr:MAG: dephospho-CoA kinase [Firmicutes bacterium HGW-Firmicutes-8]
MPVIGLTGNIASGKSLVSGILKELGARVIDADIVAREVVAPGTAGWRKIKETFGEGVLNPDLTVNRQILGSKVFNDPQQREKLNAITHPVIVEKIQAEVNTFRRSAPGPDKVLVIDAPLLIETDSDILVDEVWLVVIPEETQIERLIQRDGLTREQALARIRSQMPVSEKKKYAQVIIDNSRDADSTEKTVRKIWKEHFGGSGVETH